MGMSRKERIAVEIGNEVRRAQGTFNRTGRHHNSGYSPANLGGLGGAFIEAVILGELGVTNIQELARHFSVRDAKMRALLEQIDGPEALNFFTRGIVCVQAREIGREISASGGGQLVFVRTQPTSPTAGIRRSYGENTAFGLDPTQKRRIGTFDSIYATWFSAAYDGGCEQSVPLAGLVPALEKDREEHRHGRSRGDLSPLQRLTIERPTAAMFRQAGLVDFAVRGELPPEVEADLYVFLEGRYEGYEESVFLSSPTHRVPIVGEPRYQKEARDALGDDVDIVVEAEGMSPHDRGLERRHVYVDPQGRVFQNDEVRRLIDRDLTVKLGRGLREEHRNVVLELLPGELRAGLPDGRHEGGQALLQTTADGSPVWFTLLNKRNGRRTWRGSEEELRRRLRRLAEAFALLEAPGSTAGQMRREQYLGLEEFDVPMSHASGRQNIWTAVSARRQASLPEAPLGATLL